MPAGMLLRPSWEAAHIADPAFSHSMPIVQRAEITFSLLFRSTTSSSTRCRFGELLYQNRNEKKLHRRKRTRTLSLTS
jgi:hypothetical protein